MAIGIGFAIATSKAPNAAALTIDGIQCNNVEQLVFHNHVHLGIDPKNIKLNEHDEIAIVYGKPPSNIPSRYSFSQGT